MKTDPRCPEHPNIPAIVAHSGNQYHAAALRCPECDRWLSAGYVVISLPGIDSGYKSSSDNDDGSGSRLDLIPDLEALAQEGRTIYIAFDRDSNPQTVKRVQKARQKLARLFGEFGCETRSIKWEGQYKGLDDFTFGAGQDALDKAIETAQNITPKIEEGEGDKDKKESIPSALEMSKKVHADLFDNKIRFDASVKQFWRYDGKGKWVTCSNEYIFHEVQKYLEEAVTTFSPSYVRNVIEFAIGDILHEGWTEMSSLKYLPFDNGALEMATKKLLPHSPDYGFTWQLPRSYSAIEASWGNIDGFLDSLCVGNKQLKELAIAFCAAVLTGRSDLHKFLYLFGSGRNGKGVFSNLLSMLIGKENTHSTTMTDKDLNWQMTIREDSIAAFFSDKLIIDPKGSIGCGALHKSYQGYCQESGLKSKSVN